MRHGMSSGRTRTLSESRLSAVNSPRVERGLAIAIVSATGLVLFGCGQPPPPYKPVADVKQLMQGIVDPSADVVWESVATIYTRAGVEERRPRNEAEWANVRNHAMMLTEAGNLLMMPSRAKDGDDWMKMSQELIDISAVALKAAEAKSIDGLYDVGGRIDEVCEKCHKKYWPNY
jgi:hypothetical protein